ncbi:conserved hypothetical protein [Gloeothece citriformis PCC 7424]|uniref:Uncharacterized protein n=1 Tax=Gloeothece citriformis (strain PCC 7424) TaxID=65393 RepID=B7KEV9_GLOC7|nr:hypothetical protein [Gloeothece citriformis]ACK70415.1 conserved hypothetical protein [Gloeothece citriformis PCC 7424]
MNKSDPFAEEKLNKLQLMIYLLPLVGWIPALWTLYNHQGNSEQRSMSRLSIKLTGIWLLVYGTLWTGSAFTSEILTFRLLYLNGLLTTGYILTCLIFILRLWTKKTNN